MTVVRMTFVLLWALNWLDVCAGPDSGGGCPSWTRLQDDKTQEDEEHRWEEEKQAKEAS